MKLSWHWLQDHLETPLSCNEIIEKLILLGFEVESVQKSCFEHFVLGQVLSIEKHPSADRLKVCQVIDGMDKMHHIVCGASNVDIGLKVVLALPGALIPNTQTILKKGTIRGVESQGMICSKSELMLEAESEGIWELPAETDLNISLARFLGEDDIVIDLSITPNRGDAFSIRGIARDLAAAGCGSLKSLVFTDPSVEKICDITVDIQVPTCPFFCGVSLDNIVINDIPKWMKKRLDIAGVKSIHPVVDIANFVCLDIGKPLHVYDREKIGNKIIIKNAKEEEVFFGLDEKKYELCATDIVTADHRAPLTIAGILGGKESAVSNKTKNIFIESAYFNPISIRMTGQRMGIVSESRTRFERGIDPEDVVLGLRYALYLINQTCKGETSQMITLKPQIKSRVESIYFSAESFKEKTGVHISFEQSVAYLQKLGCRFERQTPISVHVIPPSWRHDISITEDLIEEVLRLHGYQTIPVTPLPSAYGQEKTTMINLKRLVSYLGMNEVYTWSFISQTEADLFGGGIPICNPLSKDMSVLRPSLVPSFLKVSDFHERKSDFSTHIFEIANQFKNQEERQMLSCLRKGPLNDLHWRERQIYPDFFLIKSDAERVLEFAGVKGLRFEVGAPDYYHPGRSAVIRQGKTILGYVGELHPKIAQNCFCFEIFLDAILPKKEKKITYYEPSIYQKVVWDFSFIVDAIFPAEKLVKTIDKIKYVNQVVIFDVYHIDDQVKAVGIKVTLRPEGKTFTEEELSQTHHLLIETVKSHCNATLR